MRALSTRFRGLGPYSEEVSLDLEAIPGQIIAVTGVNGSGKTVLLEALMPAALYRKCPSRNSTLLRLAEICGARDAYLETTIQNGSRSTFRHVLDGVAGVGKAFVRDEAGKPISGESGKVSEFDDYVADHFPAKEVVLSSIFAAQLSPGLLRADAAERKDILIRALGHEETEEMAAQARALASEARKALDVVVAREKDARGQLEARAKTGDAEAARRACAEAHALAVAEAAKAAAGLEAARAALADAQRMLSDIREKNAEAHAANAKIDEAERTRNTLRGVVADLDARLANNRKVLEERGTIEAAVLDVATVGVEIDAQDAAQRALLDEVARLEREATAATEKAAAAEKQSRDATARAAKAKIALGKAGEVAQAAAQLPALEQEVEALRRRVENLDGQEQRAHDGALLGANDRIVSLRGGLQKIEMGVAVEPAVFAGRVRADDDEMAEQIKGAPAKASHARQMCAEARAELRQAEERLSVARATAARAGEMAAHEKAHEKAIVDVDLACADVVRYGDAAALAGAARKPVEDRIAMARTVLVGLRQRRTNAEIVAKRAEPLAAAEARIAALEPERARAAEALAQAETGAAASRYATQALPDLAPLEARARDAERWAQQSAVDAAKEEHRVAEVETLAGRLGELAAERAQLEEDVADWTRLGEDLGKDGLQAVEIDAIGPELSALTNELLHTCHGPRYTVTLETTRKDSKGKREIEGCELSVLDTSPDDGAAGVKKGKELSPGQGAIVGEALASALATIVCRIAGIERPTLVRDETASGLDSGSRAAYVAMLRKVATRVGADRVLIVSHAPELIALCDAEIHVSNGRVVVRS